MFGSKKKEKIAVVFDIGSSSVGGAYVSLLPGQKPKIIATAREQMVFQEDLKFDRFVSSMLDALDRVAKNLSKQHSPFFAEKIFICSFSSPWYASQTRIATKKEDKPLVVTEKTLADMIFTEVEGFKHEESKRIGKEGVIMEHESIQVKLNGYETDTPIGKPAKSIETAVYVSIVPDQIFSRVNDTIRKSFHISHMRLHSFPFVAFVVIRDTFHESNFLFLDISGEVTDVSLVRGGVLQETASFPYGKNFLLRKIAAGLSSTPAEAISELSMHRNGDTHEKNVDKLQTILNEAEEDWRREFHQALSAFSGAGLNVPVDIFFTADSDVCDWFAESIARDKVVQYTRTEDLFRVRPLQVQFFSNLCDFEKGVERDPFLALEAVFARRLFLE